MLSPTELVYTAVDDASREAVLTFSITVETPRPTFGSLTIPDRTYRFLTAFEETLPEAPGGAGTTDYSLALASGGMLPDWLMFDPATRRLSGTPTELLAPTDLLYTAVDDANLEAVLAFSILVEGRTSLNFDFIDIEPRIYALDQEIETTLPEANFGNGHVTYAIGAVDGGAEPPNWLQFDPATRIITATPDALLDTTAFLYTATDQTGEEAQLTFSIAVTLQGDPKDHFVTTWRVNFSTPGGGVSPFQPFQGKPTTTPLTGAMAPSLGITPATPPTMYLDSATIQCASVAGSRAFTLTATMLSASGHKAINSRQPMGRSTMDFHGKRICRSDEASRFGNR